LARSAIAHQRNSVISLRCADIIDHVFVQEKFGFDFSSFFILILQALAGDRECISKLKSSVKEMNKTGNSKSISNLFFLQ
jgi:hypothetical protein